MATNLIGIIIKLNFITCIPMLYYLIIIIIIRPRPQVPQSFQHNMYECIIEKLGIGPGNEATMYEGQL